VTGLTITNIEISTEKSWHRGSDPRFRLPVPPGSRANRTLPVGGVRKRNGRVADNPEVIEAGRDRAAFRGASCSKKVSDNARGKDQAQKCLGRLAFNFDLARLAVVLVIEPNVTG
jgi:hypothetical protein